MKPVATAQTRAAAQDGMLGERSLSRWAALAAADVPALLLLATEPEQVRAANDEGARDVAVDFASQPRVLRYASDNLPSLKQNSCEKLNSAKRMRFSARAKLRFYA